MLIKVQYSGICIPDMYMYMENYTVQLASVALTQAAPIVGSAVLMLILSRAFNGLGRSFNNKAYDRVQISSSKSIVSCEEKRKPGPHVYTCVKFLYWS